MPWIARSNVRTLVAAVAAALTMLAIAGCGTRDASARVPTDPFPALMGEWVVDAEATMEDARDNHDIDPGELEQMPAVLEKMMRTMSIQMTPEAMVTRRDGRQSRAKYSVKSTSRGQVVVSMRSGGQDVTCTFELLSGNRMRFKSSAASDMDHYIWTRMPSE